MEERVVQRCHCPLIIVAEYRAILNGVSWCCGLLGDRLIERDSQRANETISKADVACVWHSGWGNRKAASDAHHGWPIERRISNDEPTVAPCPLFVVYQLTPAQSRSE